MPLGSCLSLRNISFIFSISNCLSYLFGALPRIGEFIGGLGGTMGGGRVSRWWVMGGLGGELLGLIQYDQKESCHTSIKLTNQDS